MLHDIRTAKALAYAIFFVGFASVAGADPVVETVSAEELSRLLDEGVKVIDVRRADEWRATGVIAGSQIITAFDAQGYLNPHFIEEVSVSVGRSQSIALICRSGHRSAVAVIGQP